MDVAAFDYQLPEELIAKAPLPERDASRLLVLPRTEGAPAHRSVRDLPDLLREGDLLVVNDAKVIPARLRGHKEGTGGKVELLLVEPLGGRDWLALGGSSKPLRPGAIVEAHGARIEIAAVGDGEVTVRLPFEGDDLWRYLDEAGETPLPPYIDRPPEPSDRERYQTIFARERGAVAAPTAGLHFTDALLESLRLRGISLAPITLYVGPGTFLPVRSLRTEEHRMHRERYTVPPETAEAWSRTRERGGRVIADQARPISSSPPVTASAPSTGSSPTSTCRAPRCSCWSRPSPASTASSLPTVRLCARGTDSSATATRC